MPRRNLRDNAAAHDFVSDFASRPLANRACFRLFTSHGDHLGGLLGADLGMPSWTRGIPETLLYGQIFQGSRLQADPAGAPQAHRIYTDAQLTGNLRVIFAFGRCQDDASSQSQLLGSPMSA